MSRPLRVAALGYYGFSNLGDEAVLAGIRAALATEPTFNDATFIVLSNAPEETKRLHPGVRAANRWKWREASNALKGTDLFILGGGSLLQDATSVKSVVWYMLMAMIARRRAKRVLWWGQGVGPLKSGMSRRLVSFIGNQADRITVRDKASSYLLKEIDVGGSIEIVADPAFALHPVPINHERSVVLLSLRHWKEDRMGQVFGSDLPNALQRVINNEKLIAVPMHLPEDKEYTELVLPGVTSFGWNGGGASVLDILGQFARASQVIAMRLHALIFAARCAVPFVAISYDPKVDALATAAGQEDALLPLTKLTSRDALLEKVALVQATSETRRESLRAFSETQYHRALQPARIAAEILG